MATGAVAVDGPRQRRHAVVATGELRHEPYVLVHGFGTDQRMWGRVAPALAEDDLVVTFDHVGAGAADAAAHDARRHASLHGYADDLVALLDELDLPRATVVGHSAGGMIGVLASLRRPERVARLVLIGASARYLDDEATGYVGGFTRADVDGLLEAMDLNYTTWAAGLAPVAMGNPDRPELADELRSSFLRTDSRLALAFARAIFLSDHRADLGAVRVPTTIVEPADDPMVPPSATLELHHLVPGSRLVQLAATGHFPQVSAAAETIEAIRGARRG